jgi:simple sugar transport system permease protein
MSTSRAPSSAPPSGPASRGALRRALTRPEAAAAAGTVAVWLLFALAGGAAFRSGAGTAAILNAAASLGILAAPVALLMIAGEFDLSVGSTIGACGMALMLLTQRFGWTLWPAVAATVLLAALVGLANGWLVVRTRLPSFLVTLGTLYVVRGLTVALSRLLTGRTQLSGLETTPGFALARPLFAADIGPVAGSVVWWLAVALLAEWVLRRTRFGNWTCAAGGAPAAAREAGVPVARVKIALFLATSLAAALVAVLQAARYGGADALRGEGQEFRAIVAAVIGGTLLAGGYGSALGALLGALVFGMVQQGIVITGIDADWFQVVLGSLLVAAVLFNDWVRRRAEAGA